MHRDAGPLQQPDHPLARDAGKEAAGRDRREHFPAPRHEDVGGGEFRDIAVGIGRQRVVEALGAGLKDHPCVVGIKAGRLGIGRHGVDRRPAEPRRGDGKAARLHHRDLFQTEREIGGLRIRRQHARAVVFRPVHRPDVDVLVRPELRPQPVKRQPHDFLARQRRLQAERARRIVDALRMQVEIGMDALEIARAIEHQRAEPGRMRGGTENAHVALMPVALVKGPDRTSHSACPSWLARPAGPQNRRPKGRIENATFPWIRSTAREKTRPHPCGFAAVPQCTAAYMIFSSVASCGENSSTMRPWRETRMRSDRLRISGR